MIPYSFERILDVKTGEIGVTCYNSYGTKESYKYVFWANRRIFEKIKISSSKGGIIDSDQYIILKNNFDDITKDQIINFLRESNRLGCLEIISRRLTSDYFSRGTLVFFTVPGHIRYNKEICGPEYPFIIKDIKRDINSEFMFHITLSRYEFGKDEVSLYDNNEDDAIVSYSLLDFFKSDGYSILSRYDFQY